MTRFHVSLDFWNTIAVASEGYKKSRDDVLKTYGCLAKYHEAKKTVEQADETGKCTGIDECYNLVIDNYGTAPTLRYYFEEIFRANPPVISSDMLLAMRRARAYGITMSIASNTNFISGKLIREVLERTGVDFSFMIFSDEIMFSKPHEFFFKCVKNRAPEGAILWHVGDNPICDWRCVEYGINAIRVNNTLETVKVLNDMMGIK